MRIAQIGDIHISDSRIKEFEIMLDDLATCIVKQEPEVVVFTGDAFIHRDKLSPKQVELARVFFKEKLKGIHKVIIVGNHDVSLSAMKTDSLSAIFSSGDQKVYTEVGAYEDFGDTRFHMYPYPTKKEMNRLDVSELSDMYKNEKIEARFNFSKELKNVLVYHGTLEGADISDGYKASEEAISIGKDLIINGDFWHQFDACMCGHLHKYQTLDNAVYSGVHFPLTFADSDSTGFVMWDGLDFEFIKMEQRYPFMTVDVGDLTPFTSGLTDEAVRRIYNEYDYDKARIRIKYKVLSSQSGNLDHAEISKYFKSAQDIKIVPEYINKESKKNNVSFEDFQEHTIFKLITDYIDDKKYHRDVKKIAKAVETRIEEKYTEDTERGIHFKLDKLKVNNFKCFQEENPEIDFNKLEKVVGVFGRNKMGKSSLIEAIVWSLFGTTMRNKDVKSVIRNGQKGTVVELLFSSYGQEYKIIRKRTDKTTSLTFFMKENEQWMDISGATAVVTQKSIEKIVGSFDIFISTIYSPQNGIDLLVNKKPSERKQIIMDCLQIDVLDKRQKEIVGLKKHMKEKVAYLHGRLNTLTDQITTLVSTHPSERLGSFEGMLKEEKKEQTRLNTHLISLSKKVYEYELCLEEQSNLTEEINEKRAFIKTTSTKITDKKRELEKLQAVLSDTSLIDEGLARIDQLVGDIERYDKELRLNTERRKTLAEINARIKKVDSSSKEALNLLNDKRLTLTNSLTGLDLLNCSKPDCPINEKVKANISTIRIDIDGVDDQINERKNEYYEERKTLERRQEEVQKELDNSFWDNMWYAGLIKKKNREEANGWGILKNKITSGDDIINNMSELIAAYMEQLDKAKSERDNLVGERNNIATKLSTIDQYNQKIEKVKVELKQNKEKIENYNSQINGCKKDIENIQKLQKDMLHSQNGVKKHREYLNHCNKYAEIVGKHGVMFSIVDKSLPIIEKFAQDIISETTNGMISVSIDSFRKLAKGNTSDEVMIYISDAKGKRDIREASGSELVLVSLALRAALAYLLSVRMGSKVELFIVDEGFGAFDDENLVSIKDLLKRLGEKFNKVLFITHVQELKDVAQSIIKIHGNSLVSSYDILKGENND